MPFELLALNNNGVFGMVSESGAKERAADHISFITGDEKRALVKIAVEMALDGNFSGIAAMTQLEMLAAEKRREKV